MPEAAGAHVDDAKVRDYLLNAANEQNGGKARLFERVGFERGRWGALADALKRHAMNNDVIQTVISVHGTKHVVQCSLPTPDGTNPCFTSVWIIEANQPPRLVTAY